MSAPENNIKKDAISAGVASAVAESRSRDRESRHHGLPLPTIVPALEQRYLPFPLTDIQQAYWVGRQMSVALGGVSTHRYFEIDCDGLDLERLNLAWQRVVDRHDMLRAIITPDGQQQILQTVPPYQIKILDLRAVHPDEVQARLQALCEDMSHQVLPSDQWPVWEIRVSLLEDQRFRLHLSFDALIVDARGRNVLFADWFQFYQNLTVSLPPLEVSFRDYVMSEVALKKSDMSQRAEEYWRDRLASLPPPPDLPLAKSPVLLSRPRFVRFQDQLEPELWTLLKERASRRGFNPTMLLLAVFAEVLKVWSTTSSMTINMTLFNRIARDPRLKGVVGDFTSSCLLAIDNEAEATLEARARRVQQQLQEDLKHSSMSGVQVIRQLVQRQQNGFRAVMPVVFTSLLSADAQFRDASPMDWLGDVVYTITQTPQVYIDHQVREQKSALIVDWDVVEELFPVGMIQDMFQSYVGFLRLLAEEERNWQATWSDMRARLFPAAQLQLQTSANATEAPASSGLLHTLFAEQVSRRPDHTAIIASDRCLTYNELSHRSLQIACRLRQHGAKPNKLIGVVMEKGWEQVVAVLGILQAGAAYLPIDPHLPKERRWYLFEHGQVEIVLTQPSLNEALEWPEHMQRLCVSNEFLESLAVAPLDPVQRADDLAYVIYTSGSTGLPKGVMIDHRGAVNTIVDINQRFGVGPTDRVLALSSLSFDLSVYDIFGTLAAGGTILMPDASGVHDPAHWAQLMRQEGGTVWNSAPALMEMLIEYLTGSSQVLALSLRLVLLSGDWIPVTLPGRVKAMNEGAQIISLGGATEASIWSILYPVEKVDPNWKSIPYGKPMENQHFHVLSPLLEPCPVWVPGELYIGGIGLAKGYWRDEERTLASFIQHPRTGERLYKTGDLGRYLPDGNIEFLGRKDFQVKIQGYRVELGEIETTLAQHPGVRDAVVMITGQMFSDKRLVAYIVPKQDPALTADELRRFLEQKLPRYMVPSTYIMLDRLPLNANGKVDRRALPLPITAPAEARERSSVEPTILTARIAQLIGIVLKVEFIHPDANLLNLGATSIDMIRIANRLENELNFRPKIDDLYRFPTAADIARLYAQQQLASPSTKVGLALESLSASLLGSFTRLLDPEEIEAFKKTQSGLRQVDETVQTVALLTAEPDKALKKRFVERRSHRRFALTPISLAQFSEFLGCLRQITVDGHPKYQYGSAGGLYPVQVYMHIKPGRVTQISSGTYYYHPVAHRLVSLLPHVDLDRRIYDRLVNRPIFDEAAFALFLIAQLSAITPVYGEHSLHYAVIEAGAIAQLLETSAPAYQLGLCQIGSLEFEQIRPFFKLGESCVLAHSLLGGLVDNEAVATSETSINHERKEAEKAARVLQRIKQLSKGEVKALLEMTKQSSRGKDRA